MMHGQKNIQSGTGCCEHGSEHASSRKWRGASLL